MKATTTSVEAERPSTWIERFAIPIAASSMEAQPIALVIVLLTLVRFAICDMFPVVISPPVQTIRNMKYMT